MKEIQGVSIIIIVRIETHLTLSLKRILYENGVVLMRQGVNICVLSF